MAFQPNSKQQTDDNIGPETQALAHMTNQPKCVVKYLESDLFEAFPDAIVNVCSCVGLKRNTTSHRLGKAFPSYSQEYRRLCLRKKLQLGQVHVYDIGTLFGTRFVFSLPLRRHWNETLKPPVIRSALRTVYTTAQELGIRTLAFPLFEGPPHEWLHDKFLEEAAAPCEVQGQLEEVLLFKEE